MTTLGLIGSGNIGGTVARLALAAGLEVVLSNSRGPHTLAALVDELGAGARAATVDEAAATGDIVVVSIPLRAYLSVPVGPLRDKAVIDTNNYYPARDGQIAELDDGSLTSSGLLQRHLTDAHVVKAFNNIYFKTLLALARPAGAADRSALPIAGDSPTAKAAVTALLDQLGYDTVDAGPIAESWRFQPDTPAYGSVYMGPDGWNGPPASAAAAVVQAALAAA